MIAVPALFLVSLVVLILSAVVLWRSNTVLILELGQYLLPLSRKAAKLPLKTLQGIRVEQLYRMQGQNLFKPLLLAQVAGLKILQLDSAMAEDERTLKLRALLNKEAASDLRYHERSQRILRAARQILDCPFLDEILLRVRDFSDPITDLENYPGNQKFLLIELITHAASLNRPMFCAGRKELEKLLPQSGWQALFESRGLKQLGVLPYMDGKNAIGALVVGWSETCIPVKDPDRLLELVCGMEQQYRQHGLSEQLRILNRGLRDGLKGQENHLRSLEQQLQLKVRELDDWRHQAVDAGRLKSEFLSSMSHELRTPLNAIKGYNSIVLKEGNLSPRQNLSLERVRTSADNLLKLINDILDYSRLESGRMSMELEIYNACALCRETLLQLEPLAHERRLDFELVLAEPEIYAVLDRSKIERILINLLGNAIKFTDRGGVRLLVFRREGMLVFEVRDTGIGIHPDERALIFQHFRQGDGSSSRQHGGTGLGLAITTKLVEQMGGRMELDSELGRGSTFRIFLPIFLDLDTARQVLEVPPQAFSAQGLAK